MTPLRVGLTGGIAAGKSTVATWFREAGFTVIDADQIVADLYRPGSDGTRAVTRLFGPSFLTEQGGIDHPRLAQRVFTDPQARKNLEEAIHPLVKREFEALATRTDRVIVLEAPLLVEAGLAADLDFVISVEADPEIRIERAITRGLSAEQARQRLTAQTDKSTRSAAADVVLQNEGTLDELRSRVDRLIQEIESRADDAQ